MKNSHSIHASKHASKVRGQVSTIFSQSRDTKVVHLLNCALCSHDLYLLLDLIFHSIVEFAKVFVQSYILSTALHFI